MEEKDWKNANKYFDQVIALDSENGEAYLGNLLASLKCSTLDDVEYYDGDFSKSKNYKKVLQYADNQIKKKLMYWVKAYPIYIYANSMVKSNDIGELFSAIQEFQNINDYRNAEILKEECLEKIYVKAKIFLKNSKSFIALQKAEKIFLKISGYKDADILQKKCHEKMKAIKTRFVMTTWVMLIIGIIIITNVINNIHQNNLSENYNKAVQLMQKEEYYEALKLFEESENFKDTNKKIEEIQETLSTILNPYREKSKLYNRYISAGSYHTVGLKKDGTVMAVGNNEYGQCDVSKWKDIIAVSAGTYHTVGLKKDGTVIAVGNNEYGQCDVSKWKDIVAVSAEYYQTAGLKKDGTVVVVGNNDDGQCNVSDWENIIDVSAGNTFTVGLKQDGTIVTTSKKNRDEAKNMKSVISVLSGYDNIIALKKDGTIVTTNTNNRVYRVSDWKNIVAYSVGSDYIAGLQKDGKVVIACTKLRIYNLNDLIDTSEWRDIVAISISRGHTVSKNGHIVGLRKDGKVVALGDNQDGQCNVSDWEDMIQQN